MSEKEVLAAVGVIRIPKTIAETLLECWWGYGTYLLGIAMMIYILIAYPKHPEAVFFGILVMFVGVWMFASHMPRFRYRNIR
jgi:hypothetical protein